MGINTKYLKKMIFLRYSSFGKLNQLEICFPVVYRLLRFGEKKYAQKSPDVNVLVISRDGSLKVFNKNELKNAPFPVLHRLLKQEKFFNLVYNNIAEIRYTLENAVITSDNFLYFVVIHSFIYFYNIVTSSLIF